MSLTARSLGRGGTYVFVIALLGCAGVLGYRWLVADPFAEPIIGVVRETEINIASEKNGRLVSVLVTAGQRVRKGDTLAVLSSPELVASVQDARAAAAQARANRDNIYAGVRKEQVDISAQGVQIAEANLKLAQQQHERSATLAYEDFATRQRLDEDTTALRKAEVSLDLMRAAYARNMAGPTKEERASADAKVTLAAAATADLEADLAKTRLVAPLDGIVGLLVAVPGEVVSPGQSVLTLEAQHSRWFSFTIREDMLGGIGIGATMQLVTASGRPVAGRVTELRPLGEFATWRAARAVGDHDLNSFVVRVDPIDPNLDVEPGMTVWLRRQV
jgi:HlyD family secretion protein